MGFEAFMNDVRNYLRVTYRLGRIDTPPQINVGDVFTVQFTLHNIATSYNIIFLNPALHLNPGRHAAPLRPGAYPLPRTVLRPYEQSTIDVEFRASRNIGGVEDWWAIEEIAYVTPIATLDSQAFFRLRFNNFPISQEIEP